MTLSRWTHLRLRTVSDKSCRENQNTHFKFSNFFTENRAAYEKMGKNMVEPHRPQTKIRRMRFAFLITKATDTLRICNTYCFRTATIGMRTRHNVTLCVHCPSCCSFTWSLHANAGIDLKLLLPPALLNNVDLCRYFCPREKGEKFR
jgi:hypothetical protein